MGMGGPGPMRMGPRGFLTEEEKKDLYEMELRYSFEDGVAEGEARAKLEGVCNLVEGGICDAEKACAVLGVPIDDYKEYLKIRS